MACDGWTADARAPRRARREPPRSTVRKATCGPKRGAIAGGAIVSVAKEFGLVLAGRLGARGGVVFRRRLKKLSFYYVHCEP